MRKVKNKFIGNYSFLFCFFICLMVVSIFDFLIVKAEESTNVIDFSRKGSISIVLSDSLGDNKVEGAEVTIYKVADAIDKDNNLAFDYYESLNSCKADLDEGNITNKVLDCVIDGEVVSYDGVTDTEGNVLFTNLDLGLYLVTQKNQVEGYSKFDSFTVMIPQMQDNQWIYDIEAEPKVDIIRLFDLTVEKVWNVSTNVTTPKEVIIELLKDDEVIDTVTLNNENNWSYTWKQIEMSDKYLVKEKEVPSGYTVTYSQDGNKFVVTNTKSLVQTGRSIWTTPILATIGLLFVVVGIILEKRKKYE